MSAPLDLKAAEDADFAAYRARVKAEFAKRPKASGPRADEYVEICWDEDGAPHRWVHHRPEFDPCPWA